MTHSSSQLGLKRYRQRHRYRY